MSNTLKIAVIAGDGIGKEVVPEGMRALEAVARKHAIGLRILFKGTWTGQKAANARCPDENNGQHRQCIPNVAIKPCHAADECEKAYCWDQQTHHSNRVATPWTPR